MKKLKIEGGHELSGTIRISGAKNSSVALIPAALLATDTVTICNVPEITDTDNLCAMLEFLGAKVRRASESVVVEPQTIENKFLPESYTKKLRASYYFMGALLGKYKHVEISLPGGCSIGARPINLHLKGFEALGARVDIQENKITVTADKLVGANIYLDFASVGATINIMLAAVKAEGKTIIENAAREPEIVNVANFLNLMGARITGAGTEIITIKGVTELKSCYCEVIPDRIEAATYIMIGAVASDDLTVENIIPEHLHALTQKLKEMGADIQIMEDKIHVTNKNKLKATRLRTLVYPGFPTDMQQIIASLMTQAEGESIIEETIFENRFQNIYQLKKMGAKAFIQGNKVYILGPTKLKGTDIVATDLRAGAGLVLAALIADGVTTINNTEYILRGYENMQGKLNDLGAKISLIEI